MENAEVKVSSIEKLSIARNMLAQAKTLDDILNIRDIAEAARVYAQAAKLGLENQNEAAEVKIRAERKAGEMLAKMPKAQGGQPYQEKYSTSNAMVQVEAPTLSDLGIERMQSSRWQQIASLPEEVFEEHVAETKADHKELTTASVLKIARQEHRPEVKRADTGSSIINLYSGDMIEVLSTIDTVYDVVIADPPYNVTEWEWDKFSTPQAFIDTTERWLTAIIPHLNNKYCLFWFCSPTYSADIEMLLRKLELPIQSRLVWHRRNMAKGSDAKYKFVDSWEMIFHCGNKELNFPANWDASRFDVQTFAVPQTNFTDTKYHPTQKPEDLIRWLVEYGSFYGDTILDPFGGSGTTGAVSSKRNCDLIETNDEYLSVIEQRLNVKRL